PPRSVTKSGPLFEGFSHFVTSMTAPIASGWSESPGGPCTHWKAPPFHGARRGRPLPEIMAEAVRIHAPYTHVPYHQRIDDGFPNFVNNDHCLLSARAAISLQRMLPEQLAGLPLAQTIWYIPSGLDIWNQKILKAPGHYATRCYKMPNAEPPKPVVYWPDQEPLKETGPLNERLNNWLTLVERGQVIDAYRTFLGLMEETEHRREVLAQLVFAGMID